MGDPGQPRTAAARGVSGVSVGATGQPADIPARA